MVAVLVATSYSRGGFSLCLAASVRRVVVPGGSKFHLEPVIIHLCWNLLVSDVLDAYWNYQILHYFRFVVEGG